MAGRIFYFSKLCVFNACARSDRDRTALRTEWKPTVDHGRLVELAGLPHARAARPWPAHFTPTCKVVLVVTNFTPTTDCTRQ